MLHLLAIVAAVSLLGGVVPAYAGPAAKSDVLSKMDAIFESCRARGGQADVRMDLESGPNVVRFTCTQSAIAVAGRVIVAESGKSVVSAAVTNPPELLADLLCQGDKIVIASTDGFDARICNSGKRYTVVTHRDADGAMRVVLTEN